MRLRTDGELSAHELAEVLWILSDWCGGRSYPDLRTAVDGAVAHCGLRVDAGQRLQVARVLAALADPQAGVEDPVATVDEWIAANRTQSMDALSVLVLSALESRSALAPGLPAGHGETETSPVREDLRMLTLPGRFCLLAFNEYSGKLMLPDAVLGLGIAAAALAELVLAERICIDAASQTVRHYTKAEFVAARQLGELVGFFGGEGAAGVRFAVCARDTAFAFDLPPVDGHISPLSAPAGRALLYLQSRSHSSIGKWLAVLADAEPDRLLANLAFAGVLAAEPRRIRREKLRYRPVRPHTAGYIHSAIVSPIARNEYPALPDVVLLELVRATGLDMAARSQWTAASRLRKGVALAEAPYGAELECLLAITAAEVTAVNSSPGL